MTAESKVVGCIGSHDPQIREYVHDTGLCSLNFRMVEIALRHHLARRDMLRVQWHLYGANGGIKRPRYEKIIARYAKAPLGTLATLYGRALDSPPEVVAALESLIDLRNDFTHNHYSISENGRVNYQRLTAIRDLLRQIAKVAYTVSHTIQVLDTMTLSQIVERMRAAGFDPDEMVPVEDLLREFVQVLRVTSPAETEA